MKDNLKIREFENLKIREKNSIRDLSQDGTKQKILVLLKLFENERQFEN